MPKSTQTRKDESDGKYTKPRPNIFALLWKDVGMDEALYIYDYDFSFLLMEC